MQILRTLILLITLVTFCSTLASAQIGGHSTYSFLNTTPSARLAAVGGFQPALDENDLSMSYQNPALLDSSAHNHVSLGYVNYLADLNMGFTSYARNFDDYGIFQASIQYLDYGTFQGADEYGNKTEEFSAGDMALTIGHARYWRDNFRYGANLKLIYSALESYTSLGAAIDLGGVYLDAENEFGVALTVRNLGMQFLSYTRENREPLPLDIQVGATKKLINAPFRFTLVAHSLQNPDLTYRTGRQVRDMETGEFSEEVTHWSEKALRHFTASTELVLGDNLQLRAGYNHQRRRELALDSRQGMTGFSWGFGLGISRFQLEFSRATYHLAATSTHITISSNMNEWFIQ